MQAMSYTGHQFSGAIRNGILPVADVTSHLPVVRLHGLEQEVLFLLQSKASHNQTSTSVFSVFLKKYRLSLSSLPTLTDVIPLIC